MISVGKYMAAARGAPNMAAKSAGIPESAKMIAKSSGKPNPGNLAGLEGGKSAWIQPIGSGYGRRPRRSTFVQSGGVSAYVPHRPSIRMGSDMRKPDYSRVTTDQDLSRLI